MRTEAGAGVMWPQAKENLGAARARRGWRDPPLEPWTESSPAATLMADLWPPEPGERTFLSL